MENRVINIIDNCISTMYTSEKTILLFFGKFDYRYKNFYDKLIKNKMTYIFIDENRDEIYKFLSIHTSTISRLYSGKAIIKIFHIKSRDYFQINIKLI